MTLSEDDLLKAFVEEALEHLSAIETDFLALEKAGDDFDPEVVNRVFRAAHSIKGGAGFIGLVNIKDLSHKMETVLGRFRKEKQVPSSEIINTLLLASDTLKNLVLNVGTSDKIDISRLMDALSAVDMDANTSPKKQLYPDQVLFQRHDPIQDILSEMAIPENDVSQARNEGKTLYVLKMSDFHDAPISVRTCEEIIDDIKAYTTFLSRLKWPALNAGPSGIDPTRPAFLYVAFASVLSPEDVILLLDISPENLFKVDEALPSLSTNEDSGASSDFKAIDAKHRNDEISPSGMQAVEIENGAESFQGFETSHSDSNVQDVPLAENGASAEVLQTSIRVNTHLLDSLMNLAGELVLGRNQLLKAITAKNMNDTEKVAKRVDAVTSDLQQVIMLTRMQPVGSLFNRFPRIVRDFSHELGKAAELVIEGAEVELDRSLLEAMSDPLNHLIRNAVDHGIETLDTRKRRGKDESGRITLRAFNEAGQVVIEVSDDGAGIDPEKVAAEAVSKGFVSEDQVRIMSQKDKLNLIFIPGFSTARQVSELSGRGVGMDVVKTNLDNLGGLIDLVSAPGIGTQIKIKLPLTLAIIHSQIISSEGERFAIPQMNLEELIRITARNVKERIERVGDAEVVRLREKLLPLVRLTDILKVPRTYIDPETQQRKTERRLSLSDRRSRQSPMFEDDFPQQACIVSARRVRSTAGFRSAQSQRLWGRVLPGNCGSQAARQKCAEHCRCIHRPDQVWAHCGCVS